MNELVGRLGCQLFWQNNARQHMGEDSKGKAQLH